MQNNIFEASYHPKRPKKELLFESSFINYPSERTLKNA